MIVGVGMGDLVAVERDCSKVVYSLKQMWFGREL